jgi:hypothetical protein
MTFFILIPLGLLLTFLGEAAITIFSILAILIVVFVLGLLGEHTGHPGVFWASLVVGSIGVVVAWQQNAKYRVRHFIRFAETKLILTQDPTGWELYWIIYKGQRALLINTCETLGISARSVCARAHRKGVSHQQAFDHFAARS